MTFGSGILVPPSDGGGGGATIVATSASLPGTATNGSKAYVTSQKAEYTRIAGAWVRTATDPSWLAQTTWYIASTGTADATGADDTHPVSEEELRARLGEGNQPAGITVYVLDDLDLTSFVWSGQCETDGDHWLYFEGVPTVAATGTIASVTNWDATTNTTGVITGSSSLVAHVGKLLRITGGARAGAQFWLVANPSGSTVRISQPLAGAYDSTRSGGLQVGDPYEVLTLPYFADSITVQGTQDVEFGYLRLGTGGNPHTVDVTSGAVAQFDGCDLSGFDCDRGSNTTAYCCRFTSGMRAQGDATITTFGCVSDGGTIRSGGRGNLNDHVSQGDHIVVEPGAFLRCDDSTRFLAGFDYGGAVFVFQRGSQIVYDGYLCGSGITGTYARLQALDGAHVELGHAPAVSGTGTEAQVGGTATGAGGRKRSFAQLPWTHAGSGAKIYLSGAAAGSVVRTEELDTSIAEDTSLLGATATTTSTASHSLTLSGPHPRTVRIVLAGAAAGTYTGTWTVSGQDINGNAQSQVLTASDDSGGITLETTKTFKPGTVTVSRTAMGNTNGSYAVTVGAGIGLSFKSYEGATHGFGQLLSATVDVGQVNVGASFAKILGPTLSPPHGAIQFETSLLGVGSPLDVCYLATE